MMRQDSAFKRAVIVSISAHVILFVVLLLSPYLPKPAKKGMVHYVSMVSLPGGGGGGGGGGGRPASVVTEEQPGETQVPERQSLKDLTLPDKLDQVEPKLRHPTENPERDNKPRPKKKAVIQKQDPAVKTKEAARNDSASLQGSGSGSGSGLRIGGVGTGSGVGFGSEYAGQIGMSSFPFTYYLQRIRDLIASNWIIAQVSPGIKGTFLTTVVFRIYRSGRISKVDVLESSKIRTMDMSAVRAVMNASPFPPLPAEYEDEYLEIRLIFEHSR